MTCAGGDTRHDQQGSERREVAWMPHRWRTTSLVRRDCGAVDGGEWVGLLGEDPTVGFIPVSYVYDPAVKARSSRVAFVISAPEVDRRCQIAASEVRARTSVVISARPDFVTGVAESSGL